MIESIIAVLLSTAHVVFEYIGVWFTGVFVWYITIGEFDITLHFIRIWSVISLVLTFALLLANAEWGV